MPDFFKKCHLNSKECSVLFQTKRTNSYIICSYQQQVILNNCLFVKLRSELKLRVRVRVTIDMVPRPFLPINVKLGRMIEFDEGYKMPFKVWKSIDKSIDRSLALDDGTGLSCKFVADAIFAEQEKELPADHRHLSFRWCTHTSNAPQVHMQVTQRTNSRNRQKTIKLSKQNCETLGLLILLSSEC